MGTESQLIKIKKSQKVNKLAEYLVEMSQCKFTGYIKVNFSQGGVSDSRLRASAKKRKTSSIGRSIST